MPSVSSTYAQAATGAPPHDPPSGRRAWGMRRYPRPLASSDTNEYGSVGRRVLDCGLRRYAVLAKTTRHGQP
jgi:hypothetical protein